MSEFPESLVSTTTNQPPPTHWSEGEAGPNRTRCDCRCRCPTSRCRCDCRCPYRGNRRENSLLAETCQPGFTKLCPLDGSYCPASSITLCPVREEQEVEEEEEESARGLDPEVSPDDLTLLKVKSIIRLLAPYQI